MTTLYTGYQTTAALFTTTSLDSLATSATWLAGRACAYVDNRVTKYTDSLVNGKFKTNNSAPTAGIIQVWVGGLLDDGSITWPDAFDGTDKAVTCGSVELRNAEMIQLASIACNTTANQVYFFNPVSIASKFGGVMPKIWWLWVTHNLVTALNATATNGGQCYASHISYNLDA